VRRLQMPACGPDITAIIQRDCTAHATLLT
jgi:hypothetical protein